MDAGINFLCEVLRLWQYAPFGFLLEERWEKMRIESKFFASHLLFPAPDNLCRASNRICMDPEEVQVSWTKELLRICWSIGFLIAFQREGLGGTI